MNYINQIGKKRSTDDKREGDDAPKIYEVINHDNSLDTNLVI